MGTTPGYDWPKAAKRLYTLRVLKRAGVANSNILNIYKCSVRSILEYAVAAWQDIPEYLSSKVESIQRRVITYHDAPRFVYYEMQSSHPLPAFAIHIFCSFQRVSILS